MARLHFISGLPRAGSTLLAAILRQNPRFHAGMMSPLAFLVHGLINQTSAGSELAPLVPPPLRRRLALGLFDSFYADTPHEVIFDTNRAWCARLGLLRDLFPEARVIACVRNVAWILDSLERLWRANPYEYSRLFASDDQRSTVFTRVQSLVAPNRLVGYAYQALKEACHGEHTDALLLLDYDALVAEPQRTLAAVYDFLGEPGFAHDFTQVDGTAMPFDEAFGLPTLHTVRRRVEPLARRSILPPELFREYAQSAFWRRPEGLNVRVLAPMSPVS